MINTILPDGTSVMDLKEYFYKCLSILQEWGWSWENDYTQTPQGVMSVMRVHKETHTHIVVSDDVETMVRDTVSAVLEFEMQKAVNAA